MTHIDTPIKPFNQIKIIILKPEFFKEMTEFTKEVNNALSAFQATHRSNQSQPKKSYH